MCKIMNNCMSQVGTINEIRQMCIEAIEKFDSVGYTNDFVKSLKYGIDSIEEDDIPTLSEFYDILKRFPTNSDIIDYVAYKLNINKNISKQDIIKILIDEDSAVSSIAKGGVIFSYNNRKNNINKLKHGYFLTDAIQFILDNGHNKYEYKDRYIIFGFINNNIFLAVEVSLQDGKEIRIISFRESNEKEWQKYARQ